MTLEVSGAERVGDTELEKLQKCLHFALGRHWACDTGGGWGSRGRERTHGGLGAVLMGTCAWAVFRGRERGRCSGDVSMGGVQGDVSVGEPDGGRGRVSMAASMPALACAGVCVCV